MQLVERVVSPGDWSGLEWNVLWIWPAKFVNWEGKFHEGKSKVESVIEALVQVEKELPYTTPAKIGTDDRKNVVTTLHLRRPKLFNKHQQVHLSTLLWFTLLRLLIGVLDSAHSWPKNTWLPLSQVWTLLIRPSAHFYGAVRVDR